MHLIEIYKAGGRIEAESLRAALLDAGIECQLGGEPRVSMPGLSADWSMAPVYLVVADTNVERARPVIDEWRASLPPSPTTPQPSKRVFQYSMKAIFVMMTINALVCTLAYHLGVEGSILAAELAITALLPANLMVFGYLRKRRRQLPDE